jgi:hypothetical protein
MTSGEDGDFLTPNDLKKIESDKDMEAAKKAFEKMRHDEDEKRSLHQAFQERDLHPDVKKRVNAAVRRAAEQGKNELQIIQFPAKWLEDGGRAINNEDPDWPKSLTGFSKRAYDYYVENLRPLGFKLSAKIISFPEGMLGDVGIFLHW